MKKYFIGAVGAALIGFGLYLYALPDGFLHVYFLDVGQGDAILIRTPSGKNILVDTGPGNAVLGELAATLPFWDKTLDYVFLTHPDRDHVEGFFSILPRYPIGHIFITGAHKKDKISKRIFQNIRDEKIPLIIGDESADLLLDDGVTIDLLYPFFQQLRQKEQTNNNALVFMLTFGEHEILFTGDIEKETEETLVATGVNLNADILKIPHHGSKTSSTSPFLNTVTPEISVISVGKGNSYGHPHSSVMERLQTCGGLVLRTDVDGRIEMVFSKTALENIGTQGSRSISAPSARSLSSKCS